MPPKPDRPLSAAIADYHRAPSPLGLHDLLRRFTAACYQTARAHQHGTVHLGLNPRQVFVGEFEETSVAGWDTDRSAESDAYTAAFLAPEQAAGAADKIGLSADVYALGAILYAILTGQPPYTGASGAEVLSRVRDGLAWQPRMVAGRIPAALEGVCLTALEPEPAHRYPSPVELAREVERWMAGERVRTNYAEPKGERLGRWLRSRYGLLTLIGLLLASLIALAVAIGVIHKERQYNREDDERLAEKIKEAAAKINPERQAASDEFKVATVTLRDLALLAQGRPSGDQTLSSFKGEVLRRINIGAGWMAEKGSREGTHLAAANDCMSLAEVFQALGRFDDARHQYEQAVRIARVVENAGPENRAAMNGLFLAARGLAQMQLALRDPDQARQSARSALAAADPNNLDQRRDVAFCHQLIALASEVLHDWPAARAALDQRLAVVQTWAKADSPNVPERLDLANAWIDRGDVELRDHDFAEGIKWYDRALAVLKPLETEGKLRPFPQELARLAELKQKADDCRSILKSIDDINVALQQPPDTAQRLVSGRAAALARMGRLAEAAATAEKLRELKPQDGNNLYNVACCYALCVPAVGRGKSVDALSAEEKAARAGYVAQSVKDLRAAFAHGFRNLDHLEADADLDALHDEASYQSFVAEQKALRLWLTFPVLP